MSEDDVLFGYRLRLFALAGEIGIRPACRAMGVHHSTYYRWAEKVERWVWVPETPARSSGRTLAFERRG